MDRRGATPLHRAASKGNLEIVKFLVGTQNNIKINARDAYGSTPLHLACEEDRHEIAKFLVENGADLEIKNKEEKTPIDLSSIQLKKLLQTIKTNN